MSKSKDDRIKIQKQTGPNTTTVINPQRILSSNFKNNRYLLQSHEFKPTNADVQEGTNIYITPAKEIDIEF